MHFYGWKKGLKTGMYYLRTKPRADAIQFTVDQLAVAEAQNEAGIQSGFAAKEAAAAILAAEGAAAALVAAGAAPVLRERTDSADSSVTGASESSGEAIELLGSAPSSASASAEPGASPLSADDKAAQRAAHKAEMSSLREKLRQSKEGYGEDEGVCLNCSA